MTRPPQTSRTHVVLVGAGHTHLHVLDRASELRDAGVELTLIAPATFEYSGFATATATGALPRGAGRIDVADLAVRRGVGHVVGRAVATDPVRQRVQVESGDGIGYDLLSINVGSVAATDGMDIADDVFAVKPFDRLDGLTHAIDAAATGGPARVSVVGGGPTGLEMAGNLAAHFGERIAVTLFDQGGNLGGDLPSGAARRVRGLLRHRGVRARMHSDVHVVASDHLVLADGTEHRHDVAILATGLVASPVVAEFGLGDGTGIPVRATLQHVDHPEIYAVGDAAHFTPRPLPKLGVYGVRQGPVLLASLLARQQGAPLPRFVPQRHALRILDLGGGVGLASRGRWWWYGRSARWCKLAIDRRWLGRYR